PLRQVSESVDLNASRCIPGNDVPGPGNRPADGVLLGGSDEHAVQATEGSSACGVGSEKIALDQRAAWPVTNMHVRLSVAGNDVPGAGRCATDGVVQR